MAGLGAAEFDRTVTQKLPLVANDAAIFALASELGWCSSWLAKPRPPPSNEGGDVSVALMNAAAAAAPTRRVATPVPVVAVPVPMAAAPSAAPVAPVALVAPVAPVALLNSFGSNYTVFNESFCFHYKSSTKLPSLSSLIQRHHSLQFETQ